MPEKDKALNRTHILTAEEWLSLELLAAEKDVLIGSREGPLVRPQTKNLIEAAEKSFKTTFLLRLMIGLSRGETVYPAMPVARQRRVLYLHGELSDAEIQERTQAAVSELQGPFNELIQGKALQVHLIESSGQYALRKLIEEHKPDDLVLDPWQSFISGFDENSFKDTSRATNFCDKLIEAYGLTLWIPIHLGKNRRNGARGHSCVSGWRDTLITLTRSGSTAVVSIEPRWAKSPPRFQLRFENGTLRADADVSTFGGQSGAIHEFVKSRGGKALKSEVAAHLGKTEDAARKAIERAETVGAIFRDGDYVVATLTPETDPDTKTN